MAPIEIGMSWWCRMFHVDWWFCVRQTDTHVRIICARCMGVQTIFKKPAVLRALDERVEKGE